MSSHPRQSNRRTGAHMREQLIDAGTRLLEEVGPEALQARRVAAEAGTSTMAVYTHFEGMPGLVSAIVAEAFIQFGAALEAVAPTEDPTADFLVMGAAYRQYALASPQRYRLMFGLTSLHTGSVHDFTAEPLREGTDTATYQQLVTVVQRMIDAGRIRADPTRQVAARLWGLIHGVVLLELTGHLGTQGQALTAVLGPATIDLLTGMGSDTAELEVSMQRALGTIIETFGLTLDPGSAGTE
ncbi:TetR/AcrR family transcriptional regulator [Nocardia jiangxiensis]|uniref:TetR/AcrR family transcriptional regulator n=1 Tax=Nocardia jiangxiensis TaxID=282685 RepID=A0ABW6S4N3_9NOCA|nr:TetR/AcrR family transcriptional regulator [Nocardia jiangxiensis]